MKNILVGQVKKGIKFTSNSQLVSFGYLMI